MVDVCGLVWLGGYPAASQLDVQTALTHSLSLTHCHSLTHSLSGPPRTHSLTQSPLIVVSGSLTHSLTHSLVAVHYE